MGSKQKLRKRTFLLVTTVVILTALLCCNVKSMTYVHADDRSVSGLNAWEITQRITLGWNLGNSLDSVSWNDNPSTYQSVTAWGNPEPTRELFEAVKKEGFHAVRIPVTWYQHINYNESTETYEIEEDWMRYVKKIVDYAYELDMFIIINIHHENWINVDYFSDYNKEKAKMILEDVWKQISDEFEDYDQRLIFEGMNEPRQTYDAAVEWGNGDWNSWMYINELNEVFIHTVRNSNSWRNKERLLMIPSYHATDNAEALYNLKIPDGAGNIAISVHAYEPYSFTMDTQEAHKYQGYNRYGGYNPDVLKNIMYDLKKVQDSKGVPIIIGEFGASDFNNTSERAIWAEEYMLEAQKYGFSCFLWDNNVPDQYASGECFGAINRYTNEPYDNAKPVLTILSNIANKKYYNNYSEWIKLYSSMDTRLTAWDHLIFSNTAEYLDGNYQFAVVYRGDSAPRFILENQYDYSWNIDIQAADNSQKGIAYYSYADIVDCFSSYGVSRYDMGKMILMATCDDTEIYSIFAIPN